MKNFKGKTITEIVELKSGYYQILFEDGSFLLVYPCLSNSDLTLPGIAPVKEEIKEEVKETAAKEKPTSAELDKMDEEDLEEVVVDHKLGISDEDWDDDDELRALIKKAFSYDKASEEAVVEETKAEEVETTASDKPSAKELDDMDEDDLEEVAKKHELEIGDEDWDDEDELRALIKKKFGYDKESADPGNSKEDEWDWDDLVAMSRDELIECIGDESLKIDPEEYKKTKKLRVAVAEALGVKPADS